MRTLVTFLGRSIRPADGYQHVAYELPDGSVQEAAFVGYALADTLGPDRLVILGTTGSMWDQLLEAGRGTSLPDTDHETLMEAVDAEDVGQTQLDTLAAALTDSLGRSVTLALIPSGLTEADQAGVLDVLVRHVEDSDELYLDITHSYRHLPMLVVMAVLYLRALRPALTVQQVFYARLRQWEKRASVQELGGILHFADWLTALQRTEVTGDYRPVADLIADPDIAQALAAGSFKETIHQGQQARGDLRQARQGLAERPLTGAGALFQPLLTERTDWVDRQQLDQRQAAHARAALAREDFLRAALYGFEAYVTRLVRRFGPANPDPNHYATREAARFEYEQNGPANADWAAYKRLRGLRNVLAHGNQADGDIRPALQSRQSMRRMLGDCLDTLLPETPGP